MCTLINPMLCTLSKFLLRRKYISGQNGCADVCCVVPCKTSEYEYRAYLLGKSSLPGSVTSFKRRVHCLLLATKPVVYQNSTLVLVLLAVVQVRDTGIEF